MKSALFVDFDNVFSQLRQLQPEAAERFAQQPAQWMRWLIDSLALPDPHDKADKRRLLVRRCYLNPHWYQTYRNAFLRAGFEIVDCPPVTSQGKTSTDIHMVLDVIDLLQHETRYDEFIVFSADADFTPVLRKLRRHDRRTTVLAIGFPAAAYQASTDLLIDEGQFIQEALGLSRNAAEISPLIPRTALDTAQARAPAERLVERPAAREVYGGQETRAAGAGAGAGVVPAEVRVERKSRPATAEEMTAIANYIGAVVEEASQPVSAAHLALRVRQEFPDALENWNGSGTFKQFFKSLGLTCLVWLSISGGRVADPARHDLGGHSPAQETDSPWAGFQAMFATVQEVCSLTGAPMLAPGELQAVLTLLAQDLQHNPFDITATARRVCEECLHSEGLRVRFHTVTFLIRGMQLNGHEFGGANDSETTLASSLMNQMRFLCEREHLILDDLALAAISQWIGVPYQQ